MVAVFRVAVTLLMLMSGIKAFAQTATDTAYQEDAVRAKRLLLQAVEYYREQGDAALPVFSRQGQFIDGELYVYVVDIHGVLLASGGPSVRLVGQDVSGVQGSVFKDVFSRAMTAPEGQVHEAEYRWMNWIDGKAERKHAYYQRVGARVLAVGYYLPRSSPAQARDLLTRASKAVEEDPEATFQAINLLDKRFYEDDLYVFVVDLDSRRFIAHGSNRRLLGKDFKALKSADGKPIGQPMLDVVSNHREGEFEYLWRNSVTGRNERKHAYLRKVGGYLVAVGYYTRD
ncbi:cache domain-containing protein [Pseudomonas corrugata]|uniref:cache domain-containing protein n=1 Tax=Pseudomonas corrugata TaxID=47879 RepID=UPI001586D70E|nr:cache domain-containing protein [Pseudomonas corrugata]MCI0997869.1 cache domain-containing protein [Pseudomonas corrugata]NUT64721.1 calcium channel protein [Pseudomonas corrugata]